MLHTRLMKDEYFLNISSLILKFTTLYHESVLNKIVDQNEYLSEPKKFIYTICRKTKDVLEALNIFIRNYESHNQYQTSTLILLRSIISDIIVAEYVIIMGKNDVEREEIISSIYLDHIDKTYQSIDKIYKKINSWEQAEVEKVKTEFINSKPDFFTVEGKLKGKPLKTSPEKLLNRLFSEKKKDKDYEMLKLAFHYYDIFSKYEHLGELSFFLVHRVYDKSTEENRWNDIFESLWVIMLVLVNYTDVWDNLFIKERKILESQVKEFYNLKHK